MNIGYIGLGLMGNPCSRHLLKDGHKLFIWARHPEKVQDLAAEGMVMCKSPADVARRVDILFTNLSRTGDVEEVLLGARGVVEGGRSGLIVGDMSTISAPATKVMHEKLLTKGIVLADCPVSGGTAGARNASLTIMVGAAPEVFEKLRPVLACMGAKITRIGEVGAGQAAKSCNQIMVTVNLLAVCEAYKFAERLGVDREKVREALLGGSAFSRVLEQQGQRILKEDYEPGFKTGLHLKDMEIVKTIAADFGIDLPAAMHGLDVLRQTSEAGWTEWDSASMFKIVEKSEKTEK